MPFIRPPKTRYAFAVLSLASAYAQAADVSLAPIMVTATRQSQRVDQLLSDVTVIEHEAIEQAGVANLTDLLARQPGVEVVSNGGPGTASDVRIRGTESTHTVVLLDGMRVGSATLGTISWSRIPLSQIDHIEILRGPASSLYGSDALGGVIQIFTKHGENSTPLAMNAEIAAGSYGTNSSAVGMSGAQSGFRYSLNTSKFQTSGFSAITNPKSSSYNPDRDGYQLDSLNGALSYTFAKDQEVGLNFLSNKGMNGYDGGYLASAAKDYRSETDVGAINVYLKSRITDVWKSTLTAGRSEDLSTSYTDRKMSSIFRTHQDQYTWQNDFDIGTGQALLAAESLQQRVSGTSTFTRTTRTINSLLAGWTGHYGDHSIQVNGRHDQNSQFGTRNTGTAAYGYQLDKEIRLHASFGTAFKAPTFNALYFPFTVGAGVGNPNLLPETSRNAEVGVRFDNGREVASVTYFHNRIQNLIQWTEQPPAGSYFYSPMNVGSARIDGWTMDYQTTLGEWQLGGNLNLQDPVDADSGKRLARRAHSYGALTADYRVGAWKFGAELQGTGNRWNDAANTYRMGGYALVNLTTSYALDKSWNVFGRIDNLFDRPYEVVQYYGTPGVTATVGVRYTMK